MTHDPERKDCPAPEMLAAFAEGRLGAARRADVVAHLDQCEDCTTEVALAMGTHTRENAESLRTQRMRRIGALAAAVVVAIIGIAAWQRAQREGVEQLVSLAPRSARIVEPRLTGGFAWAAYRGSGRAGTASADPERLKLNGAAGEVIERAAHDARPEAQHAAAIALLLVEQPAGAIERLEAVASKSNDAKAWSDLAAARYAAAADLQRPSLYASALAAADRALQIEPALAEALFNRALILDRMRLADEAQRAWTRYLASDPSSPWAGEARARLAERPASSSRYERSRKQLELVAAHGDIAAARELAKTAPDYARPFAETEFLGRWGEAVVRGEAAEADRLLAVSRAIGDALAETSGESLLRETIAAIDRASTDDRRRMAEAHATYRAARLAYSRHEIAVAQRELEKAQESFARTRSPMAFVAGYYAAGARLLSGDVRGARIALETVRDASDRRFIALGAQIRWELGRAHQLEEHPHAAIADFTEGSAMFRRIGELSRQAVLETLLAHALDSVGRGDEGWSARIRGFEASSADGDPNLRIATLSGARKAELLAGRRDAALALARLETPEWQAQARPADVIDSLVQRTLLATALGDDRDAAESARAASRVAATFSDAIARGHAEADAAVASGAARLAREPRAAVASLTKAIDFYHAHQLAPMLAEPLLLRARALRASGDDAGAARDLEDGMRAVEGNEMRLGGVFDAEHALFEDALRMALGRSNLAAAFAIAERARGGNATLAGLQQQLAGTATVVVEVTSLPDEIVAFAISSRDAVVSRRERSRRALASLAQSALAENGNDAAATLYDDIIHPADALLDDARAVIVVPDRTLSAVPFAALFDRRQKRHLVERFPVTMAPAASELMRAPNDRVTSLAALALPSGATMQTRGLPSIEEEIGEIVPLYARAAALPRESSLAALCNADADVLHIAGHTAREADGGEAVFVFANGERVSSKNIAAAPPPRAKVIVLAACETLRPPASDATQAPSLGAAFLSAGAIDVAGTLAPIPDRDARLFFRSVHRALAAGAGAAEAVRAAQLEAIHRGGTPAWRTVALLTRRIP